MNKKQNEQERRKEKKIFSDCLSQETCAVPQLHLNYNLKKQMLSWEPPEPWNTLPYLAFCPRRLTCLDLINNFSCPLVSGRVWPMGCPSRGWQEGSHQGFAWLHPIRASCTAYVPELTAMTPFMES